MKATEEAFLERCIPEPNTGCWLWMGGFARSGYGILVLDGAKHRQLRAHRYSWMLFRGDLPDDLVIRHYVCANKACVNPAHLRHHFTKLTDIQVAEIRARAAAGDRRVDIAASYGITPDYVRELARRLVRVPLLEAVALYDPDAAARLASEEAP